MHGDGGGAGEQWAAACNQKVCGGRRIGRRRGENVLGNCGATENRSEKSIRKYQLSCYYITQSKRVTASADILYRL